MPVFGVGMHPGRLLAVWYAEDCIGDQQIIFSILSQNNLPTPSGTYTITPSQVIMASGVEVPTKQPSMKTDSLIIFWIKNEKFRSFKSKERHS